MRRIVCSDEDKDFWKECRKYYLMASDLFTYAELGGPYWPGSKSEILDEKINGTKRIFSAEAQRKMEHGIFDEDHNREKFCHYAKLRSRPAHYLIANDRWPYLAATLDGVIAPPTKSEDINPLVFTDRAHVQDVRDRMLFANGTGIAELKQSENKAKNRNSWFGYTNRKGVFVPGLGPDYYQPQIQAQMHIGEFEWCVLVGQVGAIHMTAHFFERDPAWAEKLDELNEKFREDTRDARAALLVGGSI